MDSERTEPLTGINYFTINETTGDISIFRSLEQDTSRTSVYRVEIQARDMGMCHRESKSLLTNYKIISYLIIGNLFLYMTFIYFKFNQSRSCFSLHNLQTRGLYSVCIN